MLVGFGDYHTTKGGEVNIKLGDKVRDRMTGYTGIAISRHEYLYGCARVSVQPIDLDKDGKPQNPQSFEEPQLELVTEHAFEPTRPPGSKTGGPRRDPHQRRGNE